MKQQRRKYPPFITKIEDGTVIAGLQWNCTIVASGSTTKPFNA